MHVDVAIAGAGPAGLAAAAALKKADPTLKVCRGGVGRSGWGR
jgi:2-polyprenyl-6-methoxyphenol hydroxylase-like FAD-dependent oxidoreductase